MWLSFKQKVVFMNQQAIQERVQVSVIIPCYQCSETLARAVASVAYQTHLPKEVILIDDASPDNGKTLQSMQALVTKYADVLNIQIVKLNQNQGAGSARNAGWNVATQPYIAFLDSDDAWHPKKLEIQYTKMLENPSVCLSGHICRLLGRLEDLDKLPLALKPNIKSITKKSALLSNPLSTRTIMLKRDIPFRFKDGMRYIEDYLLWLQIIYADKPTIFINTLLAATFKPDYGEAGLSSHMWRMQKGEMQTYQILYESGSINQLSHILVVSFSYLKFVRRLIIVKLFRYK